MASSSLLAFATLVVGMMMLMQNGINAVRLKHALKKNGNFRVFLDKLEELSIIEQIDQQLNQTGTELTVFAATERHEQPPFQKNLEESKEPRKVQVSLLHYHMVSTYYNFATIMKTTNPIQTQGSGSNGAPYTFDITANSKTKHNHRFNVSTGVNNVRITYALNTEYPLQIFVVEDVLLPPDLFLEKNKTAPSPSPTGETPTGTNGTNKTPPEQPSGAAEVMRTAGWLIGLMTMVALPLF